jgi:uncharacterized repeat protein (TIGR01451 family)
VAVLLTPHRVVAPTGSQVVLMAGVQGCDGYLRTNRRLEWSVAPGSVGQFVAIEEGSLTDFLVGDFTRPRKITNTYAVGSTSRRYERLTGGPGNPDIVVARGQGWITVTSPVEGTSHVMVRAPDVVCPNAQVQSALIHWIDAGAVFPPPAINPAGTRHVFTTTVLRQSNHGPQVGWIVRYEIVGGPPAGFAPAGAQAIEVPTNPAGQAAAEIFQPQPGEGTNQIRIQVIRPADLQVAAPGGVPSGLDGERLVVLPDGGTLATWTAAAPGMGESGPPAAAPGPTAAPTVPAASASLGVQLTGPGEVPVGGRVAFEILITNRGQTVIPALMLTDTFDEGLVLVNPSTGQPVPNPKTKPIKNRLVVNLAPGHISRTTVNFTAVRAGQWCHTVDVTGPDGIRGSARGCVTAIEAPVGPTAVGPPGMFNPPTAPGTPPAEGASTPIAVTIEGPRQGTVGQLAEFTMEVTNTSSKALNNIKVSNEPDPELVAKFATEGYKAEGEKLVWTLPELAPGAKVQLKVQSRCDRVAQRACSRVVASLPDGTRVEREAWLEIREAAGPAAGGLTLSVAELQNPVVAGKAVTYVIRVTNAGAKPESQVGVTVTAPPEVTVNLLQTTGPTPNTKYTLEGKTVQFDPVPDLLPGKTLTYRVQVVTGRKPGEIRLHAEAVSRDHPQPVTGEKTTTVQPAM